MSSFWESLRRGRKTQTKDLRSVTSGIRRAEIPNAGEAVAKTNEANKTKGEEDKRKGAEAQRQLQEAINIAVKELDKRALEIQGIINEDIQDSAAQGLYFTWINLIKLPRILFPNYDGWDEMRYSNYWKKIVFSAVKFQALLRELRQKGYKIEVGEPHGGGAEIPNSPGYLKINFR